MIGSSTTGLWCMLFVLSKIPEFGDTFFIVIHKKKLMFLHWYHHISVLLCCWHSFISKAPTGLFFGTMNYGVHSIMYFYYFLMAIRQKPKWFNPQVSLTGIKFDCFVCDSVFIHWCTQIMTNTYLTLPTSKSRKQKISTAKWITGLQIAQMFAGTFLSVLAFVTQIQQKEACWSKPRSNVASLLMYGSYFILFLQFFLAKYGVSVRASKDDKKKKTK